MPEGWEPVAESAPTGWTPVPESSYNPAQRGVKLKGSPDEDFKGSTILPMATAAMIGGPILGEGAALIPGLSRLRSPITVGPGKFVNPVSSTLQSAAEHFMPPLLRLGSRALRSEAAAEPQPAGTLRRLQFQNPITPEPRTPIWQSATPQMPPPPNVPDESGGGFAAGMGPSGPTTPTPKAQPSPQPAAMTPPPPTAPIQTKFDPAAVVRALKDPVNAQALKDEMEKAGVGVKKPPSSDMYPSGTRYLYHGTDANNLLSISREGLRPGTMATDLQDYALHRAEATGGDPALLRIDLNHPSATGLRYKGRLSDPISPDAIDVKFKGGEFVPLNAGRDMTPPPASAPISGFDPAAVAKAIKEDPVKAQALKEEMEKAGVGVKKPPSSTAPPSKPFSARVTRRKK